MGTGDVFAQETLVRLGDPPDGIRQPCRDTVSAHAFLRAVRAERRRIIAARGWGVGRAKVRRWALASWLDLLCLIAFMHLPGAPNNMGLV
jgi:hypothetical protein